MARLPIVPHFVPTPPAGADVVIEALAESARREFPPLALDEQFRGFAPERIGDGPTLHLDDLSEIPLLDRSYDVRFLQERARLRAGDGDLVASCFDSGDVWRQYTRDCLGLGQPRLLHLRECAAPNRVAYACWADRDTRRTLVRLLRSRQLEYLHPHMGVRPVWELAAALRRSSRRPLKVVAPPPGLTQVVNDKLSFARLVRQLLGPECVPPTEEVSNFATLSHHVQRLAERGRYIVLKLPDSAGGGGTVVLEAARFRRRPLVAIRRELQAAVSVLEWRGEGRLLVGSWETDVSCSPSAQLWIPPWDEGLPVVEGLFLQATEGPEGKFVGSSPLPPGFEHESLIVDQCWLLARLLQRLGYVGRCSFDVIVLTGEAENGPLKFIECNGRWGGTSLPMTLMNRLFGDWRRRPFAVRECRVPGLERVTFAALLDHFRPELYDARTGRGRLVFFNPGRLQAHAAVNVIALADTWTEAALVVTAQVPRRLEELADHDGGVLRTPR